MSIEELYKENDAFRRYMDAYTKKHRIPIETAMKHKLVQYVAEQYKEKCEVRNDDGRTDNEVH